MRCRQHGFTLTELFIVLAVVAVIAAGAAPALPRWLADARMVASANALLAALQHARSRAWSSGEPWSVCLTDNGMACKLGRSGAARGWLVLPASDLASGVSSRSSTAGLPSLESGLIADDLTLAGSRLALTYWPVSRSGTTATLTICHRQLGLPARQIIVSQTGRPRLRITTARSVCPTER